MNGHEWIKRFNDALDACPRWTSVEEIEHDRDYPTEPDGKTGLAAGYPKARVDYEGVTIQGSPTDGGSPVVVQEIGMSIQDAVSFAEWVLATFPKVTP